MLFVLFQIGTDRYALPAAQIEEVVPLVRLKKLPQAPRGVAGLLDYHGAPVPTINLAEMATGKSAISRLGTRIILGRYRDASGAMRLLGLIAERATEMLRREADDFVDAGLRHDGAPYLGPVTSDPRGQIQRIDLLGLLSASVRDLLFPSSIEVHDPR